MYASIRTLFLKFGERALRKMPGIWNEKLNEFISSKLIDDDNVPTYTLYESFKYLGEIYDEKMDNF